MEKHNLEVAPEQWISWGGALIVSSIAAVVFLFNTFVTSLAFNSYKEDQIEISQMTIKRLDRIETKLDEVLHAPRSR